MSELRRLVAGLFFLTGICFGGGAPSLTQIRDVLYTASGTPLNGVVVISWPAFVSAEGFSIAANSKNVQVKAGQFSVSLVATTNAQTAVTYSVRIIADGKDQTTETWSVPPSPASLTIQAVLVSSSSGGGVIPPPGVSTGVQIGDVAGLSNELASRPVMGSGYSALRAAVIDANGALQGASGDPSDCVHVDGSSGPCGTSGSAGGNANFVDSETPGGPMDGVNAQFSLSQSPDPGSSLILSRNGLVLQQGNDYTLSGSTISFQAAAVPQPGDIVQASFRTGGADAGASGGAAFVDAEIPSGVVDGANSQFSLSQAPNPGSSVMLMRNGLVLQQGTDYSLSGSAVTFQAAAVPQAGDVLQASYRAGDTGSEVVDSLDSTTPNTFSAPQTFMSAVDASDATSVRLNTPDIGATPIVGRYTCGAGGCTAGLLARTAIDGTTPVSGSSGIAVNALVSDTASAITGVFLDTGNAGQVVRVGILGQYGCKADGAVTSGDLLIVSATSPGMCSDSGQFNSGLISSAVSVAGKALGSASASGQTVPIELRGPGQFGGGYVSQFAGAVARSSLAKAQEMISAGDYGAVGDGGTLTGCAIQAGTSRLSCNSGNFNSGDVSKVILVQGAGNTLASVVNVSGSALTWVSGDQWHSGLVNQGMSVSIGGVAYPIVAAATTSLTVTGTPICANPCVATIPYAKALVTTISSVSGGAALLAANAVTTTSGAYWNMAVYGHDNTLAFQNAFAVFHARNGTRLYVPHGNDKGVYLIASGLSLDGTSSARLECESTGQTTSTYGPTRLMYLAEGATPFISARGARDPSIRGCALSYANAGFTGYLLDFEKDGSGNLTTGVRVEDSALYGDGSLLRGASGTIADGTQAGTAAALAHLFYVYDVELKNNWYGNAQYAIQGPLASEGGSYVHANGVRILGGYLQEGFAGPPLQVAGSAWIIQGVSAEPYDDGYATAGSSGNAHCGFLAVSNVGTPSIEGLTITGNTIEDASPGNGVCIDLSAAESHAVSIRGNQIAVGGTGIRLGGPSRGIDIVSNEFRGLTTALDMAGPANSTALLFEGNDFQSTTTRLANAGFLSNPYLYSGQDSVGNSNQNAITVSALKAAVGPIRNFSTTFSSIPTANVSNGDQLYCSDCKNAADDGVVFDSAAASGGHGTLLLRENGVWRVH